MAAVGASMRSTSSRTVGMVVLLLALMQLQSVAAAGKTYPLFWTYPFKQNFYAHWNKGTEYVVGDSIKFLYNPKYHNVVRVKEQDYLACHTDTVPHDNGETIYHLNHPGRHFFICTHLGHCAAGMKLSVNVNKA